jgi:hypothetical protein
MLLGLGLLIVMLIIVTMAVLMAATKLVWRRRSGV